MNVDDKNKQTNSDATNPINLDLVMSHNYKYINKSFESFCSEVYVIFCSFILKVKCGLFEESLERARKISDLITKATV